MPQRRIDTSFRTIAPPIPHPDSRALLAELERCEPRSLSGMPPVVWHRAQGFQVWDAHGNKWIDFSSSVVLANAGHAHPLIEEAIREQLATGLWHNYCNPSAIRLRLTKALLGIVPPYLDKAMLLTTGSEATECAIKLMRLHGQRLRPGKVHILSYRNSFHGRTMASQTAGGFPDQKAWMGLLPGGFHQIPFPECARCPWGRAEYRDCGRECLERGLAQVRQAVPDALFAGVLAETFQGPFVAFMPADYAQALREWTSRHGALLAFDEIQAGFGRTGRWFGFEHYGIDPDLVCLGKGMTSSLPMSAVVGRGAILDLAEPGDMSSTHTGNPLCCAAALANIQALRADRLVENAQELEPVARRALECLRERFPTRVGAINGRGLAWAVYLLDPVSRQLDVNLGIQVTDRCLADGLFLLQTHRGTLKIAPPLCVTREALLEGLGVIEEALAAEGETA